MTVTIAIRRRVRERAGFACEYCGVSETDTAGELTIDHFQPQTHDGLDSLDNLVYCCHRCNGYKGDYWQNPPSGLDLWNPRREPAEAHFLELADGTLHPLTPTGRLTLHHLRLNRPPLVTYRLEKRRSADEQRLLTRLRDIVGLTEQLTRQQAALLAEHGALLEEQRHLLRLLLEE